MLISLISLKLWCAWSWLCIITSWKILITMVCWVVLSHNKLTMSFIMGNMLWVILMYYFQIEGCLNWESMLNEKKFTFESN
jgi:hypothetical protein